MFTIQSCTTEVIVCDRLNRHGHYIVIHFVKPFKIFCDLSNIRSCVIVRNALPNRFIDSGLVFSSLIMTAKTVDFFPAKIAASAVIGTPGTFLRLYSKPAQWSEHQEHSSDYAQNQGQDSGIWCHFMHYGSANVRLFLRQRTSIPSKYSTLDEEMINHLCQKPLVLVWTLINEGLCLCFTWFFFLFLLSVFQRRVIPKTAFFCLLHVACAC